MLIPVVLFLIVGTFFPLVSNFLTDTSNSTRCKLLLKHKTFSINATMTVSATAVSVIVTTVKRVWLIYR